MRKVLAFFFSIYPFISVFVYLHQSHPFPWIRTSGLDGVLDLLLAIYGSAGPGGRRAHIIGVSHACCFSRAWVYRLMSRTQVRSVGRWLRIVLHQTSKNSGLHVCEHFQLVRSRDCGRANALISLGAIFHHFISLGNMLASPRSRKYSGGKITLMGFTKMLTYFYSPLYRPQPPKVHSNEGEQLDLKLPSYRSAKQEDPPRSLRTATSKASWSYDSNTYMSNPVLQIVPLFRTV